MDFTIPLIALTALGLIAGSNKSVPTSSGKYKPIPQGRFEQLDDILWDLEERFGWYHLRDYFITIAWIESRFYPSAINYEPGKGWQFESNDKKYTVAKLFPKNKWVSSRYLWEYTGGLFQLFPYVALNTADGKGDNLDPTLVFDPYYSIAFAIDLAYRHHKNYNANTFFEIRLAWAALDILNNPDNYAKKIEDIKGRLHKSANENDIDPSFLYEEIDTGIYSQYGFKGTLLYLQKYKKDS